MHQESVKTVLNWSSGKDAALAYHLLQPSAYTVSHLLTTLNTSSDRIVMHGVRETLLDAQAQRMNLPMIKIKLPEAPDDKQYKAAMQTALTALKRQGITAAAYGDIFLEDLKIYREAQLSGIDMQGVFPLWKKDTRALIAQIADIGIRAMIVCVNERFLGKEFLGRTIDRSFLNDLPEGVDPCGENGEFHTYVYDAPFFEGPIAVQQGDIVYKTYKTAEKDPDRWNTGFYFLDLTLL